MVICCHSRLGTGRCRRQLSISWCPRVSKQLAGPGAEASRERDQLVVAWIDLRGFEIDSERAATVCVHRPVGRFHSGEIRCPPLTLKKLSAAA